MGLPMVANISKIVGESLGDRLKGVLNAKENV